MRDFDRPLNDFGRSSAFDIGKFLAGKSLLPDLALCSSSQRTRETLERMNAGLGHTPEIAFSDRLYNASSQEIVSEISFTDDLFRHVIVIGHNPGLHLLAMSLCDTKNSRPEHVSMLERKFPPGSIAHFQLPVSNWAEIQMGRGQLVEFTYPKALYKN